MVHNPLDLLDREEGADLEFKGQFPEKQSIAAVLCAFANTAGGDLVIGVSDRRPRKVVGLSDSEAIELEHKISSIAMSSIEPRIAPFVRIVHVEGSYVLAVRVEQGYQRPYKVVAGRSARKVFVRVGSSTRQADPATVQRQSLDFLRKHLPTHAPRTSRGRKERLAYPELAFHEFMINAFCHRSYETGSGPGTSGDLRQHLPPAEIEMKGFFTQVSFGTGLAARHERRRGQVPVDTSNPKFHPGHCA